MTSCGPHRQSEVLDNLHDLLSEWNPVDHPTFLSVTVSGCCMSVCVYACVYVTHTRLIVYESRITDCGQVYIDLTYMSSHGRDVNQKRKNVQKKEGIIILVFKNVAYFSGRVYNFIHWV